MPRYLNDGSSNPPRLLPCLNLSTLNDLPEWSSWPKLNGRAAGEFIRAAGFEAVEINDVSQIRDTGLPTFGSGKIDRPEDALPLAKKLIDANHRAGILHLGTGFEDDATADALVRAMLDASTELDFPLYLETHRATIAQDIWRTIQLVHRHPALRFNGDFSHYYTGLEMPYGDIEAKWKRMQPIFDRVAFMHGRIGNANNIQVDVGDGADNIPLARGKAINYVAHFREMWTRAMNGFLRNAGPGDCFVFSPEILRPSTYYARQFVQADGTVREESDRYAQALVYLRIAKECFEAAKTR